MGWNIVWLSIHNSIRIPKFSKYFFMKSIFIIRYFIGQESGFYFWQFRQNMAISCFLIYRNCTTITRKNIWYTKNIQFTSVLKQSVVIFWLMTFYASFSLKNSMKIGGKILWDCRKYDCSTSKMIWPQSGELATYLLTYWGACSVQQLIVVGPIPTTIKCALRWSFTTRLPIRQRKLSWKIPWERRPNSWQGATWDNSTSQAANANRSFPFWATR